MEPKINHILGADVGYSSYYKIINYKAEANINYVINPGFFCAKFQGGIAPATNFGTLTKAFISVGFSTKTNKVVSWHLLHGFGIVQPSKITYNNYTIDIGGLFLESGLYIKPFANKNKVFGINGIAVGQSYHYERTNSNSIALNVNLSFNIILSK